MIRVCIGIQQRRINALPPGRFHGTKGKYAGLSP